MQAIINGEMYEVEPAVKVIIDKLMIENAELKKENARLEEGYQKSVGVIAATDCVECKRDKASKCDVCEFNRGFATWKSVEKGFECTSCKCVSENSSSFCQYCGAMMVVSG